MFAVAMAYVDDDASSGSGDDVNLLDGHKRQAGMPSNSCGVRKRGRKATGAAIVDAMLEIASASKMRASAIVKNEERFSINKCIKVLDEMQGVDERIYFLALDLFEDHPNAREVFISLKDKKRLRWLQGYLNTEGFIAPYQGVRYQHYEFRGANQLPRNAKELFNHRHCFLRNAILRSFNVLKTRFPILKLAPQYSFQIQRDIVIAGCVLHNFIRREERNDWIFNSVGGSPVEEISDIDELPDVPMLSSIQEQLAFSSRDSIASSMWDDFLTKWDEW